MDKQRVFMFLVLTGAILSQMAGDCFADATSDLQTADNYYSSGLYPQAEQIYQNILGRYSGTVHAFEAQKNLAILYIAWGKDQQATAAVDALKTNFSGNVHITEAVHETGQQYRQFQQYSQATQLYQCVIDTNSECEYAIWAQMDIAISNMFLGNDEAADAAAEKLLEDYSGDEHIAEAVYGVANQYRGFQRHQQADQLYRHVVSNWPDSEHAKWSQMALAVSDVIAGDTETGHASVKNLITQFSGSADITKAVHDIAQQYRWLQEYEKACELYRYILDKGPEGEYAIWAQMDLAISNICLGDMKAANKGIAKLLTDYSGSRHIPTIIYSIAQHCCWAEEYDWARFYYQYILDNRSEGQFARWSQMALAALNILPLIESGNQSGVQSAFDSLIADFNDCPDLPDSISQILSGYQKKISAIQGSASQDCYSNPIDVWEKAAESLPNLSFRYPDPYIFIADCYRQVGGYDKAIQCYSTLLDNWPDCKYAWHALFMKGRVTEQMQHEGLISSSEAKTIITAAYQQLVEKYPQTPAAKYASAWLRRN